MVGVSAGASEPAKDEECLALEGAVMSDGISYVQSDYLHARAGTDHSGFTSPTGAPLLLRGGLLPSSS
jgi:hypothetical protein